MNERNYEPTVPKTFTIVKVWNETLPVFLSIGMMETVRIRRSGYPVRREFKDFLFRYGVLGREVGRGLDDRETCVGILMQYDATNKDWQLGKTKASCHNYDFVTKNKSCPGCS